MPEEKMITDGEDDQLDALAKLMDAETPEEMFAADPSYPIEYYRELCEGK